MGRALPGVIQCLKSQGGPTSDSARVVLRASTKPAQTPALPAASLHCSPLDFVTATKQNQWEGLGNLCKSLTTTLWRVSYQAGTVLVSQEDTRIHWCCWSFPCTSMCHCCNSFFPTDSCKWCLGLKQVVFLSPPPSVLLMQSLSSVAFNQH